MAQDNLATIQAALKAVGETSDDEGLEPLQNDKIIQGALEAASKPVKVLKPTQQTPPPSGMVDWRNMPAHALGGLAGAWNTVSGVPGMVVGGLASGPAAALHAIFGDSMPTGQEALEEGEDLLQVHPTGEIGRGTEAAQQALSYPFTKGSELGGSALAGMFRGEHALAGEKLTPGQQAKEEAFTRTEGEAITNALMALAGGKAGEGGLRDVPRRTSDTISSTETSGIPKDVRESILQVRESPGSKQKILQKLPQRIHAWLEKDPSSEHLAAAENELSMLRQRVPAAREAIETALSAVRIARQSEASPGLQQASGGGLDVSSLSRGTPQGDFQSRLAQSAPKPATPEAPEPAKVQSDMAALESPYRYRPEKDAATVLPKLPKYLSGAKPKMGEQKLEFASDLDRAAYIVANPRTRSGSHAEYLDWLAKALGTDENTALLLAKRSKEATVASVKAGQPQIQPYLRPKQGEPILPLQPASTPAPEAQVRASEEPLQALDKSLEGTSLTRTPVPEGMRGSFAQENHLRMGQGQGEPLPYLQLVRDVFPTPADEVINAIGEKVFQQGRGDPTRVHLPPDDLKALDQALSQRGWPIHRRDLLEKLSAALTYALDNRQSRNEGYAPMRAAIQDHNLMGDVLRNPENYAVTAKLREFKPPRDFEKVCV